MKQALRDYHVSPMFAVGVGVAAGIIFVAAEVLTAFILSGQAIDPLKMMASIPLQEAPPNIPLGTAVVAGGLFHLLLSGLLGYAIAAIIENSPTLHETRTRIIIAATVAGFLLWPVNFYVFAPLLNVPWFMTEANQVVQFFAHTFAFGTVLGLMLAPKLKA